MKPVGPNEAPGLPKEAINTNRQLQARRKLVVILKSKARFEAPNTIGGMVEQYTKK